MVVDGLQRDESRASPRSDQKQERSGSGQDHPGPAISSIIAQSRRSYSDRGGCGVRGLEKGPNQFRRKCSSLDLRPSFSQSR